uniref:Vacuolar protein 14 C-terminal Fig4-binding domain-containing protein n=1 Tax=Neobodo designis TaxID=312471 RepID=A0A7S1MIJ3_NEODS|mmetsp:Transcript_41325/g.127690  ORF Transcript_41325/g.127690 Transcript_41325/m.127690 type:complete len:716 (+) Transcript_41325:46-2193(+)|eukprot:CAMPEP_0174873114 /NCGR_PEP_ID=MMETSP1114-20130205/74351_1 /TAXON_ID=312471 /ORGANISM="Neobodo designis, Strain CCAP 1951/1" /LENGTH=715 /DNA_ID=CAMNT_0016108425 /DNA_START=46 /DNA_END=2193 /DNA_ORIENTATION=-
MPPPAPPSELYARLQQTLADPRMEVKRRAQQEWLDHIKVIMPVRPASAPDAPDRAQAEAEAAPLRKTLEWLRDVYLRSTSEKNRKQGVLLLKDLVVHKPAHYRVPDDVVRYLVEIHLKLLSDKSEEVRSAALDLLKHIVLNVRASVFLRFPDILNQLIAIIPPMGGERQDQSAIRLYTAVEDLTRSMLNVVHQQLQQSSTAPPFDMDAFIRVVREALHKHAQNPTVCSFVTSTCIKPFRDFEHVHILQALHEYLEELLKLLNARNPNTSAQAALALKDTLPFVEAAFRGNLEAAASGSPPQPTADRVKCMIAVLNVMQPSLTAVSTKTCLQWMASLTQHADEAAEVSLLTLLSRMVRCVVPLCGDREASRQNERLCMLMGKYGGDAEHRKSIDFDDLLRYLREALETTSVRLTALNWIALVHETNPDVCDAMIGPLNRDVLKCISDGSEEVVRKSLEVLCGLARSDAKRWEGFVAELLTLIGESRQQLAARIPLVVKQLQAQAIRAGFPAEFVMCTVARLLARFPDCHFVTSVVTTLSMMLITAPELTPLRHTLKIGVRQNKTCAETFRVLYECWAYSAVWALALCLLAREYEEAHRIVTYMGDCDPSAHTLMQLDRLLQLIETPAFAFLRNALTMPRAYPYLVRTLYSVLMILPQSSPQFGALQTRLQCAAQLQATLTAPDAPQGPPEGSSPLFDVFQKAQRTLTSTEVPSPSS